jgi:hypothetical protein
LDFGNVLKGKCCPLPKKVTVHKIERGLLTAHVVRDTERAFFQIVISRAFQKDDGTWLQTPAISPDDVALTKRLYDEAKAWIASQNGQGKASIS